MLAFFSYSTHGNGYYHCQNVKEKENDSDCGPPCTQIKLKNWAPHSYPPINADDGESYKKNIRLLEVELDKPKPKLDVLKALMARTSNNCFQELLNSDNPVTVKQQVENFSF